MQSRCQHNGLITSVHKNSQNTQESLCHRKENIMEGYKVFEPDWTCRGFQYEVGKTFEEDVTPSCCNRGFHFCKELKDCFNYYPFNPDNKVDLYDFTLMLDESSLIQNQKAKQTKFILKMKPAHVILLSGTPVGGKYENLWTQVHLLGWNISEQLYNRQYVNWTTIDSGGFQHKIVDKEDPYKNIDRLKSKMREHGAIFKKTEECYELPEQVFTQIRLKAPKEYWKFQKDCIVTIEGQELVGDTSLTKLLYSRQICSQFNQNKLDAFRDLVESTQERLIVFYSFNDELWNMKKICQELDRPISEINGHTKDLTAYEKESNSVTLCQYQSASKGLNLQKCNRIIYFSLPLSSEDFEQSKKRIHRIGQEKICFYYLMICRGTVDEQILHTLEERKDFTDELFKEDEKKNS